MSKTFEELDEKYFSDSLSKLLDTKKNNNYFANKFIEMVFARNFSKIKLYLRNYY